MVRVLSRGSPKHFNFPFKEYHYFLTRLESFITTNVHELLKIFNTSF